MEGTSAFGTAVAIDRGMILVGAPDVDPEGGTPERAAGGAVYGFLPVAGRYVETFRLRPRPDEKSVYDEFGRQIAMFGRHIAIAATGIVDFSAIPPGIVFTYTGDGATLTARSIAVSHLESTSMALANKWLVVGDLGDDRCFLFDSCTGRATLYDVLRLEP